MLLVLFTILLIAVLAAWIGRRRAACYLISLNLILAWMEFYHHVSSQLTLQL